MPKLIRLMCVGIALLVVGNAWAKSPFSLVKFKRSKNVAKQSQLLTEDNGPWMIFVGAFAGEGAEAEARQLATTLRVNFRLKAYIHKKHYDYTQSVEGKGFNKYGQPKRMRFSSNDAFEEVAVLVGDYERVDDPKLQKALKTIKYATRQDLELKGKMLPTTRRFAEFREFQRRLVGNPSKRAKGPMGHAFATRNPMQPRPGFGSGLDPLLIEMNKDSEYSLLKNPSKYTVRVASFRGHVVIDQRKVHEIEMDPRKMKSRLDDAGDKAEGLVKLLRQQGIEAYVYHDRHESMVTVGSFAEIGKPRRDGKIELNPTIAEIIETYGPEKRKLNGAGPSLSTVKPRSLNGYVFDVAPQPVVVPRKSIANDYVDSAL